MKRSIAGASLIVVAFWAELTLAPMLLMHHARTDLAANSPAKNDQHAAHHHGMRSGLPCCPSIGKKTEVAYSLDTSFTTPCQDQHRCCFSQGPQSVPTPAQHRSTQKQQSVELAQPEATPTLAHYYLGTRTDALDLAPPILLGMVLRV